MMTHAVQFDAVTVVDVSVLLLRHREHIVRVQKSDSTIHWPMMGENKHAKIKIIANTKYNDHTNKFTYSLANIRVLN